MVSFSFLRPKPHKTPEGRLGIVLDSHAISLVLDIGANVGQTGQALRRAGYRGRIVSFEPIPAVHARLRAAAAADPDWTVADPMAFGAQAGRTTIHVSEASDMSSLMPPTAELMAALPKTREVEAVEVEVVTVADILPHHERPGDRVFLKVDAQGFDLDVLKGALPVLDRIAGVQVEMSLFPLYAGEPLYLEVAGFLHQQGFQPFLMTERTFSRRLKRQLQIDGVFFRTT